MASFSDYYDLENELYEVLDLHQIWGFYALRDRYPTMSDKLKKRIFDAIIPRITAARLAGISSGFAFEMLEPLIREYTKSDL